jgi:hypothetical protein
MENTFCIDCQDYETYRQGMDSSIDSFDDLFDRWDRQSHLAADLGVSPQHLRMMRVRRSIPIRLWPRLLAAGQRRAVQGLSYELLVQLHVGRAAQSPSEPSPSSRSPS